MDVPNPPVYEGDVVFLYSTEARGYLYSEPPGRVRVFIPKGFTPCQDPGFPNIHFAAFQILPCSAKPIPATVNASKGLNTFNRSLVYGQTIKFLHMASRTLLSFGFKNSKKKMQSMGYLADWKEEDEHHCLLRVQPTQTGTRRQWGEDVQTGDGIRLECITKTAGYYILCTNNTETAKFEVKVAETDSVFNLFKHISRHEKIPRRAITGASVVLIQNLDHEVYLCGCGSIADALPAVRNEGRSSGSSAGADQGSGGNIRQENTELSQRTSYAAATATGESGAEDGGDHHEALNRGSVGSSASGEGTPADEEDLGVEEGDGGDPQEPLNPVLSDLIMLDPSIPLSTKIFACKPNNIQSSRRITLCGDIFWQLENFDNPVNGDWVKLGKQSKVRIKHVPSQLYLAVVCRNDEPQSLTLKKYIPNLSTSLDFAFLLMETEETEGRLTNTSSVEIRHIHKSHVRSVVINTSQCFLEQKPISESSGDTDLEEEQYDLVYGLSLVDPNSTQFTNHQHRFRFKIEEVQNNFVQDFYHVLGVTRVLVKYAQNISDSTDVAKQAFEMVGKLGDWVRLGQNSQVRAEMLRVTKAVDVMMELVKCLEQTEQTKEFLRSTCTLLECFVVVGGKRCCFYLAKKINYVKFLLKKVGCGIEAEKVLSALARDEMRVTRMIVNDLINSRIMDNLREKDVPTLDLLSTLCFSRGHPIRTLQDKILQVVIGQQTMQFRPESLARSKLRALKPERQKTVVAQIKLFSRICKGVNKKSIEKIVKDKMLVTFEEAFSCINDSNLDPFLRSAYIDFIISTLVDANVGVAGTSVDKMWYTFDWENLKFRPEETVADPFEHVNAKKEIHKLQETIRTFPKQCTPLKAEERKDGTNEMIVQMLNAMEPMVAYGFYWNIDHMHEIFEMLISLIDGCPNHFICSKNGVVEKSNEKNQFLYKLKTKALDILYLFFLRISYMGLQKLVYDYGFLNKKTRDDDSYTRPKSILKDLTSSECSITSELTEKARQRLRYYLKETGYESFENIQVAGCTKNKLIKCLIDLIQFDDDSLRVSSCRLLFAIFRAEKTLFSEAEYSYIYTSDLREAHYHMVGLAVFNDPEPEKRIEGKAEKLIWQMLHGYAESGEYKDKAITMLEDLAKCLIMDEKEDFTPNPVNQNLAYSTGLVNRLLEYVHYYCKDKNADQADLVAKACTVLQRSARRNPKVQAKLFANYIDLLGAHTAPDAVAELLTEIFTDNEKLCRKVSESELCLMFDIASTRDYQKELFTTLQAITKVHKSGPVLIPRFQDFLARLFLKSVHNVFKFLYVRDHGRHPQDILKYNEDNSTLVNMLNVCDLLSICSDGGKKFSEDVCRAIFSLEELIKILEDNRIPVERKKPFTSLLTEVYLISDRESLKAVSTLQKSDAFKVHIDFAAQLINKMSETTPTEAIKIKSLLHHLAHRHLSIQTWKTISCGVSVKVSVRVTDRDVVNPLSSILFYIMEGFLPMILAFCNQLLKYRGDVSHNLLRTELTSVLKGIVKALRNETWRDILFSSRHHLQLMHQCLKSLLLLIPNSQEKEEWSSQTKALQQQLKQKEPAPTLNQSAKAVIKQNNSFLQFVQNYRQAYIGTTDKESFGEELAPSDPSFKALTRCFYHKDTSEEILKKMKPLLNFLDGLYQRLQQPLTRQERSDLDSILFTTLMLLSAITQCEYEKVVKPLQEALVAIEPYGAHECAIIHLAHPQNHIAIQAMAFLAALVYRGNEITQWKIGQYLKSRDTELFVRMSTILELASVSIKAPLRTMGRPKVETDNTPEDTEPLPNDHIVIEITSPHPGPLPSALNQTDRTMPLASPKDRNAIEMTSRQTIEDADQHTDDQAPVPSALNHPDQTAREMDQQSETDEVDGDEPDTTFHQEIVVEEATKQVVVVLDLVTWMCHGQRTENQELFREQESQFNSVNIVSQISIFLQVLVGELSDRNIYIAHKAIQALIELCTCNFANQEAVYKARIVDTINIILLKKSADSQEEHKDILDLKAHALELLNILLQGTSEGSCKLRQRISRDFTTDIVFEAMRALWSFQEKSNEEQKDAQKGMVIAFHILKRIRDSLNQQERLNFEMHIKEKVKECQEQSIDSEDGTEKNICEWSHSIEVLYRSKEQERVLTTVYFPFNPQEEISKEEKEFIRWNIKRDSPEEKCTDLNKWMKKVYEKKMHEKYVKSFWWLHWTCFLSTPRYYVLSLLTLVLNLLAIIFFKVPTNGGNGSGENHNSSVSIVTSNDLDFPHEYYPTLYVLGSLHLILAIWMFIEYFVDNVKNFSFHIPFARKILIKIKDFIRQFHKSSVKNEGFKSFIKHVHKLAGTIKEPEDLEYFQFYFIGFEPVYRFLFVCFSILSLAFSGYWYSGCLIYVFLKMEVLEQVRTSLSKSALQLLTVFLLGLSIFFVYAVVTFAFFHAFFSSEDDLYCQTLALCFVTVTREGLLGTLSGVIRLQSSDQDSPPTLYPLLVVFDLTFLLIITILGFNILLSIMVDSFSQLRQEREAALKEDTQEVCFICGIKNVKFEHGDESFQEHITDHHNMWNYIYFYFYLKSINPKDYSSIEKYVHDQIEKNDERESIKFYPLRKAKVLHQQDKVKQQGGAKDGNTLEPSEKTKVLHQQDSRKEGVGVKDGNTSGPSGRFIDE